MKFCAVIGGGPVGDYVADNIGATVPDLTLVGLKSAALRLKSVENVVQLKRNDFDRCLETLSQIGATDVVFAGDPYGGEFRVLSDARAFMKFMQNKPSMWKPHTVLEAIPKLLAEANIRLHSYLEYLPELVAEVGMCVRATPSSYDPAADLLAAKSFAGQLHWKEVHQACIVSGGNVMMPERRPLGTNNLIKRFAATSRDPSAFPVLCKFSTAPFDLLDPPIIGSNTIDLCIEHGIRAIVVEAGKTAIMQRGYVLSRAHAGDIALYAC